MNVIRTEGHASQTGSLQSMLIRPLMSQVHKTEPPDVFQVPNFQPGVSGQPSHKRHTLFLSPQRRMFLSMILVTAGSCSEGPGLLSCKAGSSLSPSQLVVCLLLCTSFGPDLVYHLLDFLSNLCQIRRPFLAVLFVSKAGRRPVLWRPRLRTGPDMQSGHWSVYIEVSAKGLLEHRVTFLCLQNIHA